jgi:hypothetical protein
MLRICDHPDCSTMTLGAYCVAHDPPILAEPYPRGRPFPAQKPRTLEAGPPPGDADAVEATPVRAVSFGSGS